MTQVTPIVPAAEQDRFSQITEQIEAFVRQDAAERSPEGWGQITLAIGEFVRADGNGAQGLLLQGVADFFGNNFASAVQALGRASDLLSDEQCPRLGSIYSMAIVQAQLDMPRRQRPATELGYRFFRKNVAALAKVDSALADEVRSSAWPSDLLVLQFWGGLHLYSRTTNKLLVLAPAVKERLAESTSERTPIGFGGLATGQELAYCLDHQYDGVYGMTRAHYVFEEKTENLKALLHLRDFSGAIETEELIIFGGSLVNQRIKDVFGSLRYLPHDIAIDADQTMPPWTSQINKIIMKATSDGVEAAKGYYGSAQFRRRQGRIAAGEIPPRIWIITGRWTTFLKYCAADFEKAFAGLGCETRLFIEENDVQFSLTAYHFRLLDEFKPDAVFMISHSRPTLKHFPRQLPFIGYLQDKCGPLWSLPDSDLAGHISRQDLFVCLIKEYQDYLRGRRIADNQTFIMPVPADEEMFYPLQDDHPLREKFSCDISYVKHGNADSDAIFKRWMKDCGLSHATDPVEKSLARFFEELYASFLADLSRRWYEPDLRQLIEQRFKRKLSPEKRHCIGQIMSSFAETMLAACHRRYYMEGLVENRLPLRLYGNDWQDDELCRPFAEGVVGRDSDLNAVYNFSRINLHLQTYISMHQRLSECGLAGGFMMVAYLPGKLDYAPAQQYFEPDKEIVFFDTKEDLVDKCRYYLEHEEERRQIAQNMYQRARRERTVKVGAELVLEKWRQLLISTQDR